MTSSLHFRGKAHALTWMYRRVNLICGKRMFKKWCFTFDSMNIQWNDGFALFLHTLYAVDKIIATSFKSFQNMFIKYIYALVEKIQKMLWLSVLKDTFIEQFTVDFSEQDTCKYTTCSKKSKIWLISGLKSWTCSIGDGNYLILMFICTAHNVHWTSSIWKHTFLIKI